MINSFAICGNGKDRALHCRGASKDPSAQAQTRTRARFHEVVFKKG